MKEKELNYVGYYFFLIKFIILTPIGLILSKSGLAIYGTWCGILALILKTGGIFNLE